MKGISSSSIRENVSKVDEANVPRLHMTFETINDAYNVYNNYAKVMGFSVRKHSNKSNKNGEIVYRRFVCSKEGRSDEKVFDNGGSVQRRHLITRKNCNAQMRVKKDKSGLYAVCKFIPEHSHLLSFPRKSFMLWSHRRVTDANKKFVETYEAVNIQRTHQMRKFQMQAAGYENVGCIDRDLNNYARDRKEETRGQDAQLK